MKKFDWDKFKKEKIAVHCKTEEEAKDFCQKMHEQGMKWNGNGDSFLETTRYHAFQKETCYSGTGCYCPYDYYKENEYTILEWSDYMRKEFTKADLKDGMVVEEQRGVMGFVLKDRILYEDGWDCLDSWKEDLTCDHNDSFDIIKVYKIKMEYAFELSNIPNIKNLELIWERDVRKRMTAEEMRVKLEELTGEKIEIEPSREEMVGACYEFCEKQDCLSDCILYRIGNCVFKKYSDERLKECYEKVIEHGK